MNLTVDAHTHTVASNHAYSTLLENVEYAKKNGIKAIGCTDHAHRMTGGAHRYHFWNLRILPRMINGVTVIKGAEANIMDDMGTIDSDEFEDYDELELIIASIHSSVMKPISKEYHTNAYINAIKHPKVNIIGHPDDVAYDFDIEAVVKAAKEYNKALEVNNASINIGRSDVERIERMLRLCKEYGVMIACDSDAHFAFDVGNFSNIVPILKRVDFPEELIVTSDVDRMMRFLGI